MRFKEFAAEWSKYSLSDFVTRITRRNKNNESSLPLTISAQYGLVDQITFFNKTVASVDLSGYYLLCNGDFAYNKSYSNDYAWGAVKRLDRYEKGCLSSLYFVFRPKDSVNSDYLTHYFETKKWHKGISDIAGEGARNHGLLNMAVDDYFATKHFLPAIDEQRKIAAFLNKIEKRIEIQNKIIKGRKSLILSLVFRTFCDVLTIISDFASGNALGGILNLLQLFRTIFKEVKQMVTQKNIGQIADLWKADKKQFVKKSTYAAYSLIVDTHILPAFGDKTNVGEKDVQEFVLQKLNGGLSQKTIKDMLIVLRMILKFGAKKNYCAYTPFDVFFPTDRERQELEVLSITNQKKIMRYVEENFTFRNLGIFVCLSTGMRIGEICALTWDDIDTENGVIHIRKTLQRIYIRENEIRRTELVIDSPKTATSIRDIPMTKDLLSVLKPLRKVVNEQYFVLTNDITPTEPRTYRNYYKKLLAKLEIPPIKFHGLRHSFATRCIESHCDYKTVSVILGHSNISTTLNLYVHPNYEQKKKCIDKMLKSLK